MATAVLSCRLAFRHHRDAVPDEGIFLLVDLHQRGGGEVALQRLLCLSDLGVQLFERRLGITGQENLAVVPATAGAVLPQDHLVIDKLHLPPQIVCGKSLALPWMRMFSE